MTQPQESEQIPKRYSNKIQGIRDRLGKTDEPETQALQDKKQDGSVSESQAKREARDKTPLMNSYMQMFYGRLLLENRPLTIKELSAKTGVSKAMSYEVVQSMQRMELISSEELPVRGHPKVFSIISDAPLPEGWPSKEELKYSTPLIDVPKDAELDEQSKLESAKNNPLTRMILNEGKAVFDTEGYEQFIEDTKTHRYPQELEDVVQMLHRICQERIMNKRIDCPICNRKMERNNTELYCKKCNKKIDGGSLEMSLELFRIIAKNGVKS